MESENNDTPRPHPLLRLIMESVLTIPLQSIEQISFDRQKVCDSPCTQEFIHSLETLTINEEDIKNKLSCAICQEEFKLDEEVLELPCSPQKHYYHSNHSECEGILPWLQKNNTCPVCRFEFPKEEVDEDEEEEDDEEESEPPMEIESEENNLDRIRQIEELIMNNMDVIRYGFSDRDIDEAMRRSLEE